jgi:hypothetical protein
MAASMETTERFKADDLFLIIDNKVPLQTEHAFRGLLAPLESLFPFSSVPKNHKNALEFLCAKKRRPCQPLLPIMKKDWIEWILLELQYRAHLAGRFYELLERIDVGVRRPLVLFLRKFRHVEYIKDMFISPNATIDHPLRYEIECLLPNADIIWLVNPKDAISYSFITPDLREGNPNVNSLPYCASAAWLDCVEHLAEAADIIVVANTASDGGVAEETALLEKRGFLPKTFFAEPQAMHLTTHLNSVADLTPAFLGGELLGVHEKVFSLPLPQHWIGTNASCYAAAYCKAIDDAWGYVLDTKSKVTGDVFGAVFMAISALALIRGDLRTAAVLQSGLAHAIKRSPNIFSPHDRFAIEALFKSARWYEANADAYASIHGMKWLTL